MKEKYLTLEQNTCAARIFLNTFNLILENVGEINQFSKIKILDRAMNEVGELCFQDGKVLMSANYNDSTLEASYDIAKIFGLVDRECNNALFGQWTSKISFQFQRENIIKLNGEFLIDNSIDSEFGITCLCHPLINGEIFGKEKFNLIILRRFRMFSLEINSSNYNETINIMPYDNMNGYIRHVITEYNNNCQHRKYVGILSSGEINNSQLRLYITETEGENTILSNCEFVQKVGDDNSSELLIQKGILMQQLDPTMFRRIQELRKLLLIGDNSILDNLISVCYDSYTDEEINALLGLERRKTIYQDGADNLKNSYYGIGRNSYFLSSEAQKRLIVKK